jgi:hypothetical protein
MVVVACAGFTGSVSRVAFVAIPAVVATSYCGCGSVVKGYGGVKVLLAGRCK